MKFFPKKLKPPVMTRESALRCVPVKNRDIKELRLDNGTVRLCYPLQFKPWLAELRRRFGPPPGGTTRKTA